MRSFRCERCGHGVAFAAYRCDACSAELGYLSTERSVRAIVRTGEPGVYRIDGIDGAFWRCLNAAWGCNWIVRIGDNTAWCRSCQMTTAQCDEDGRIPIEAWVVVEDAKRRLVHQLDEFALPTAATTDDGSDGVAFELTHRHGGTDAADDPGSVTIDLANTDEQHRDELRSLRRPVDGVIGRLRHQVGHHYWHRLVGQTDELEAFRRLFGDERRERTHAPEDRSQSNDSLDRARFTTAYAASHPSEDWAETFAHYLDIIDAIDITTTHELVAAIGDTRTAPPSLGDRQFEHLLERRRPVSEATDTATRAIGSPHASPSNPTGAVVDKLSFVHRQIAAHARRDRFYARH